MTSREKAEKIIKQDGCCYDIICHDRNRDICPCNKFCQEYWRIAQEPMSHELKLQHTWEWLYHRSIFYDNETPETGL